MKKINLTLFLAASFLVPFGVFAATGFSFSPKSANYTEGQVFEMTIAVNPQGDTAYTAKAELTYPADLVEVRSFVFASGWMPLSQPGYDSIDNKSGVLIKTGGYPGGFSSSKTLGTASFYVKKTGSATIKIGSNSLVLDAENKNVFDGNLSQGVFTLLEKKIEVQPKASISEEPKPAVEETQLPLTESVTQPVEQPEEKSLLARVAEGVTSSTSLVILIGLAGLITGFFVGRKTNLINY